MENKYEWCEYNCIRKPDGSHHDSCPVNPSPPDEPKPDKLVVKECKCQGGYNCTCGPKPAAREWYVDSCKDDYGFSKATTCLQSHEDTLRANSIRLVEKSTFDAVCAELAKRVKPEVYALALKLADKYLSERDQLQARVTELENELEDNTADVYKELIVVEQENAALRAKVEELERRRPVLTIDREKLYAAEKEEMNRQASALKAKLSALEKELESAKAYDLTAAVFAKDMELKAKLSVAVGLITKFSQLKTRIDSQGEFYRRDHVQPLVDEALKQLESEKGE